MKQLKIYAMMLCTVIGFSACSSDDDDVKPNDSKTETTVVVTPSADNEGLLMGEGLTFKITSFTDNTAGVYGTTKEVDKSSFTGGFAIPAYIEYNGKRYAVTSIGKDAFKDFTKMSSITIPATITFIDCDAFDNCKGLTAVHIDDLKTWCMVDFYYVFDYNGLVRCSNPLYYAKHLYLNGKPLRNIEGSAGTKYITPYAFVNCRNLMSVKIPSDISYIGTCAFNGCDSIMSVDIPDSVNYIGQYAFANCSRINSIIIGKSVTLIDNGTFYGCRRLASIEIPATVKTIGEKAFSGCSNLTSIEIPNSVYSIGASAFYNCI